MESSEVIRKALVDFKGEIDCNELQFSWNEFTMLIVIAGDLTTVVSEDLQVLPIGYINSPDTNKRLWERGCYIQCTDE